MEAVLNACWALIALASLCLWLRQLSRLRARGQVRALPLDAFLNLVCALALLFPAVSISDDFQVQQALIEDSDFVGRVLRSSADHPGSLTSGKHPTPTGIIPSRLSEQERLAVGWVSSTQVPRSSVVLASLSAGRDPPSFQTSLS